MLAAVLHSISAIPAERQERLWQDLFSNPDDWWDNRDHKKGPTYPDFKKKSSRELLWLNSPLKPSWVDDRLPALNHTKTQKDAPSSQVQQISLEIETLCRDGHLDKAFNALSRIDSLNSVPPPRAYISLLRACVRRKSAFHAKNVYVHLLQHQVKLSGLIGDYLAMTLAKCGCLDDAHKVLHTLPSRTVFSWTAIISAYIECGDSSKALEMYAQMQQDGVEPDDHTFVSLLKACGDTGDLDKGRELHEAAREKGFTSDAFVRTTLVSMYCKCGAITDAENVLIESRVCNIQSVNAMLSAYVENGQAKQALLLFRQLPEEGIEADELTFNVAIQACGILVGTEERTALDGSSVRCTPLEIGQALHADSKRKGFSANTSLGTSLVSMYGKCGTIAEVENAFRALSKHDVVSWSALLSAYVEHDLGEKSLQLFRHMHLMGVDPDRQTFAIVFRACHILAEGENATAVRQRKALEIGKTLHSEARRKGFASDVFVGNTIVSMYGKCGDFLGAEGAFDELPQRDTVSYNALLSMYLELGMEDRALQLYFQMQEDCVVLDEVTLVCALQSCSGTGCIEILRQIHFTVVSAKLDLSPLVLSALIYAYGMCASMVDAHTVFKKCLHDDVVMWNVCIAGYSREGNYALCVQLFDKMQGAGVQPDGGTLSSILSVCAHAGLINEGVEYFESMKRRYGITQDLRHYVSMVDLFARAGDFQGLEIILHTMPMQPDSDIWSCVLAACRAHGNMQFGRWAFDNALQLESKTSGAFILLSNMFADADDEMLELPKVSAGKERILLSALSR